MTRRLLKQSSNGGEDVNSKGRNTHPDYLVFNQEEGRLQVWGPEAECLEGFNDTGRFPGADRDPNI
jgi:uncharacterized protein YciI